MNRQGELKGAKTEYVPTKHEIQKEIEELLYSVEGAVKARVQLGFDEVADAPYNLKPIIKDLQVKVLTNLTKPMIK